MKDQVQFHPSILKYNLVKYTSDKYKKSKLKAYALIFLV